MGLAQRMKKGLTKMIPGDKITYKAKPPVLQSRLTDEQLRKAKNQGGAPKYKIPKTPSTGKGVGH